jgi:hypothetical protein
MAAITLLVTVAVAVDVLKKMPRKPTVVPVPPEPSWRCRSGCC